MSEQSPQVSPKIYQLKIYLEGISPMIWRRVQVSEDISLADLHGIFQILMGWENMHLHHFIIYGRRYSMKDDTIWMEATCAKTVNLKDFRFQVGDKFLYTYDFTVRWNHQVRIEKIISSEEGKEYPLCLAGKQACPPEEIRGIAQFENLRRIYRNVIANYFEIMELQKDLGYPYWPDVFNKRLINQRLHNQDYRELPDKDLLFPERSEVYFSDAYWNKKRKHWDNLKVLHECVKQKGLEASSGSEILRLFMEEIVCVS